VQFLSVAKETVESFVEENATTLLTAAGVIGTVGTAVLAGRGGFKAAEILRDLNDEKKIEALKEDPTADTPKDMLTAREKALLLWPYVLPPVVVGATTIGCIIFAHRMSAQKITALVAAYGIADKRFEEYRAKVHEHLTGPKKDKIETDVAQQRVNNTPGSDRIVIVDGGEDVLCFDTATDRYFKSSPEKIRRAVNATNAEILNHGGANAAYFYSELELAPTQWGNECGWGIGEQMDVRFDYVEAKGNRPCLSITFEKMPSPNWLNPYS